MSAQISWDTVPDLYKREDGVTFDKAKLEDIFPSHDDAEGEAKRAEAWKLLDNNGNNSVSLAEFDSWFNQTLVPIEVEAGLELQNGMSSMYKYAKPCFIRAFNLANGVSDKGGGGGLKADDYVTSDEFRLLMVATQVGLVIYRLFDIADESDDRRIEQGEWDNQLVEINQQLTDFGYEGDAVVSEDFSKIDGDGGGMVLLNEAIVFFLGKFTKEEALLAENEEEGTGAPPPPKIAVAKKRVLMSKEEKAARAAAKREALEIEKRNKIIERQNKKNARK